MRAFGARGCVSEAALKRSNAEIANYRKQLQAQERERIAALSNQDIQKIMARVTVERVAKCGSVDRTDFHRAGVPDHRIDKNRDGALRLARLAEPRLDAMGRQP